MKLSVIVGTRNRAHAIAACLDSIADAFAHASPLDAEIIVVDNGSNDATSSIVRQWASASPFPVRLLSEPIAGLARAQNRAIRAAQGELLVFTDDDCRLSKDYVNDLCRYNDADTELVLRGGRIELGDPTDLPFTIKTTPDPIRWNRGANSVRHQPIPGQINGCNMTMRRALVEKLGPFDERFGPGSIIGSGADTDFLFRAYLAYITLEYVPDMAVVHYHGRKTPAEGRKLWRRYLTADGALLAKHGWKDPNVCLPFYWDLKNAAKEIIKGTNTFFPTIEFSHKDKVRCMIRGAFKYLLFAPFAPKVSETWGSDFQRFQSATGPAPTLSQSEAPTGQTAPVSKKV